MFVIRDVKDGFEERMDAKFVEVIEELLRSGIIPWARKGFRRGLLPGDFINDLHITHHRKARTTSFISCGGISNISFNESPTTVCTPRSRLRTINPHNKVSRDSSRLSRSSKLSNCVTTCSRTPFTSWSNNVTSTSP